MTTRPALIALTAALALGTTACGSGETEPAESTSGSTEASSDESSTTTTDSGDPIIDAIGAAEEAVGGTAYEVEDAGGRRAWTIDVAEGDTSTEVSVAKDGTATPGEESDLDADDSAALDDAKVGLVEAIEEGRESTDEPFDGAELGEKEGRPQWEVAFTSDPAKEGDDLLRVGVDTVTGDKVIILPYEPFTPPAPPGA